MLLRIFAIWCEGYVPHVPVVALCVCERERERERERI